MKRFLSVLLILCFCLLMGCNEEESAYIPTGDGLTAEDDLPQSVTDPTEEAAEQELVLVLTKEQQVCSSSGLEQGQGKGKEYLLSYTIQKPRPAMFWIDSDQPHSIQNLTQDCHCE